MIEAALMTETMAMQAHNDQLAALGCDALVHQIRANDVSVPSSRFTQIA